MAATEPGSLEAIHLADREGGPMRAVQRVEAIAGVGLAGDRYAIPVAEQDPTDDEVREVTLVEAEQLDWLADEHGIRLEPGATRRNLTTRGVRLNDLVGRTFRVGAVRIQGVELCEPCAHMQELVGQPVLRPLVHRAGLRARLLDDGELHVGDPIEVDPA
jgi:MOSC domain-containing protein YiiM